MYRLRRLRPPVSHGGHQSLQRGGGARHLLKCQRCVRKCTKHAKYFDDPAFLSHVAMLEQNFTEPKENEVYL